MSGKTGIEWTDATWNPVRGCTRVSQGCVNCYAETVAARFSDKGLAYEGLAKRNPARWTGTVALVQDALQIPLRWKKPRRIFVNSMSDLFHEALPDASIDLVFAMMALAPRHTFQVLTKRATRMREYMSPDRGRTVLGRAWQVLGHPHLRKYDHENIIERRWPLKNVWLGVSVENQETADERIPLLLQTPAAKRFLSCEPLLGAVDLRNLYHKETMTDALDGISEHGVFPRGDGFVAIDPKYREHAAIDWVICGGESGAGARPMHPDWARSLRDQCKLRGVPFFFKQWGEWAPGECADGPPTRTEKGARLFDGKWSIEEITPRTAEELHADDAPDVWRLGKKAAGRLLDGVEHNEFPVDQLAKKEAA